MFYDRLLRMRYNSTHKIYSEDSFFCGHQWRSEGGQGGHLPPGAARRGAPKSCKRIFKNLYKVKFLKF